MVLAVWRKGRRLGGVDQETRECLRLLLWRRMCKKTVITALLRKTIVVEAGRGHAHGTLPSHHAHLSLRPHPLSVRHAHLDRHVQLLRKRKQKQRKNFQILCPTPLSRPPPVKICLSPAPHLRTNLEMGTSPPP